MRILIACEFSGIVREAFKAQGHDAWSCDVLPTEIEGNHIQGDVMEILDDGWDLMVAHPPCTYISNAGARFLYPKGKLNKARYKLGIQASIFFKKLFDCSIPRICIENPIPSKIFELPNRSQIIQPYQFGHEFQKKTCLWLKNLPNLQPTKIVEIRQSTKVAGNWFNHGGKNRQKNRSRTFSGIASAMAEQWSNNANSN
jgi:hypothetical protein